VFNNVKEAQTGAASVCEIEQEASSKQSKQRKQEQQQNGRDAGGRGRETIVMQGKT